MNEETEKMGTLIYIDHDAIRNLQMKPLPEVSEVSYSQSESHKGQFQIGIQHILGVSGSREKGGATSVVNKIQYKGDDLVLSTIIRLYDHDNIVCSLKDIPFLENDRIGRSFFTLLTARFVYLETIHEENNKGWFLRFKCVEYGDNYHINMGASEGHTLISYYHVQEIFGDKDPTYLTVFGSATCKDMAATKFYIKPFAIFLSGYTGWIGNLLHERQEKLQACTELIKDLISSEMLPKRFCKERGVSIKELEEATIILENAGLLDAIIEPSDRNNRRSLA